MRTALAKYVDEVVQVSGTLNTWEDIKGRSVTRLLISNPEIKKANKHVRFDQQDLISKEHHINVFLPQVTWEKEKIERYTDVYLCGRITKYQRTDGSFDFSIKARTQQRIDERCRQLMKGVALVRKYFEGEEFKHVHENLLLPVSRKLLKEIEESGNELPTLHDTYDSFKQCLIPLIDDLETDLKWVKGVLATREYRRFCARKHKKKTYRINVNRVFENTIKKIY